MRFYTELNIDNNIEITDLDFSDNAISTIDLSNNAKLEYLTAENTSLEALSITFNFNIMDLTIGTNSFTKMLTNERLKLNTTDRTHLLPENNVKYEEALSGVKAEITNDQAAPKVIYDPSHPDSDESGYVRMPNINIVSEMVDLISASRSYEANVTALNAAKGMAKNALMI